MQCLVFCVVLCVLCHSSVPCKHLIIVTRMHMWRQYEAYDCTALCFFSMRNAKRNRFAIFFCFSFTSFISLTNTTHHTLYTTLHTTPYTTLYSPYTTIHTVYNEGLEMTRKVCRADHPSIAITLRNIAAVYERQGMCCCVCMLFLLILLCSLCCITILSAVMYSRISHPNIRLFNWLFHTSTPSTSLCVGMTKCSDISYHLQHTLYTIHTAPKTITGNCVEAFSKYAESLDVMRRVYGTEHPSIADTLKSQANVHEMLGE